MSALAAILAGLGGAGQGYLRQRQIDRNFALEEDRNAAYRTMMEGQAERDKAYAKNMAEKATAEAQERDAAREWARRNGMDVPAGMDPRDVVRTILDERRQRALSDRQDDAQASRLEELRQRLDTQAALQAAREAALNERLQYQTANRQPPRDPDDDFNTQRRMRTSFMDDMLSAYGRLESVRDRSRPDFGDGVYAIINRNPELRARSEELGLTHTDWLAAVNRRAGAARQASRSGPGLNVDAVTAAVRAARQ